MTRTERVIEIENLSIAAAQGGVTLVDDVSLHVDAGGCLGIVGESGSGKSLTLRSVLGLLPPALKQTRGSTRFQRRAGEGLRSVAPRELRGHGVSMIFQEPMSSLNPTMRIGDLVAAGPRALGMSRRAAADRALQLLAEVGVPHPEQRARAWPHQLSGGQRQRVMIAMALSVEPSLLLCDEPTTALDTTVQDQILTLVERLRAERGLALIFVSHDLSVISRIAGRTAVMYAGRIVEQGPTHDLVDNPNHPYTRALIDSMPQLHGPPTRLKTISGSPPTAGLLPPGCRFAPRCPYVADVCLEADPPLLAIGPHRDTACVRQPVTNAGEQP
ncbi:dipeptide ABC transporter ATP-binding protein DppD [Streptomyces dioscori]|uniref:Dipeptide ABC transporter ATP-binding protein DppD n=1 Tax=Streptomyces dioscori TaxID=2109333 RepID=A0A2P8QF37_9ACTN|nr:ABC transporter ATP-binding protein [Streptomyces dioscori]PSM44871.1 dipeptide ABC transporter ATP-binding protein DppD [Streptomyces dioscori]